MGNRRWKSSARLAAFLLLILPLLNQCISPPVPYKAYSGNERPVNQLALIQGAGYVRQDWLNRYVDRVRFLSIDGHDIENSEHFNELLVAPGLHEITVYFSWDMGSQRGLAPALVDYASSRNTLSRTLTFNVNGDRIYLVSGEPAFVEDAVEDITGLAHVDFWVEDEYGNIVVSREQGRYVPGR